MKQRRLFGLVVAAIAACKAPSVVEDPAGAVGDAVGDAARNIATNVSARHGKHLGFDTNIYPGDAAMRRWREKSPYEWVGYYLPAPCHSDESWSGKRASLTDMGWGLAVIYVGQQTWDHLPRHKTVWKTRYETRFVRQRVRTRVRERGKMVTRYVSKRVKKRVPVRVPVRVALPTGGRCSRTLVTGSRGAADAADAIARTAAEGFPKGTVIFLDVEYMNTVPQGMRDYYRAWAARVIEDGRYRPGIYAHTRNADRIHADIRAVFDSAGVTEAPPFWIAGRSRDFNHDKAPHEVGHEFAAVWQGLLDVVRSHDGVEIPIDVNVAAVPSPSLQ